MPSRHPDNDALSSGSLVALPLRIARLTLINPAVQAVDAGLVTPAEMQASTGAFLDGLDLKRVNTIFTDSLAAHKAGPGAVSPDPVTEFASTATATEEEKAAWDAAAFGAYNEGKVGLMVLAGGQGTRLGFDRPKVGVPFLTERSPTCWA